MAAFEKPCDLANFKGKVRLFPLPNLVLFPHVMQPLHIFEQRYRDLLEASLHEDRLIAMALLSPGWEADYEGRPAVLPIACLGHISTYHRLDDGTSNLLLLGTERVRIIEELPPERLFREARAELCADDAPPHESGRRAELQQRLRQALLGIVPMLPEAHEQLDQLLSGDIGLGALCDVIAYMLDLPIAEKYGLLAELNVVRRASRLLAHLTVMSRGDTSSCGDFPPDFSVN